MALITPNTWNSVHKPIEYRVTFTSYFAISITNNGGYARFNVGSSIAALFTVGQRVYVPSGPYAGNWTVRDTAGTVTISAPYSSSGTAFITPLVNVSAQLWAGYQSTHEGYSDYPFRQIADIVAVPGLEGYVSIDVSGYLKSIFKKIEAPRIGADFRMSCPFRLVVSGYSQSTFYALNGTFDQAVLQNYAAYYEILNARHPIHFANGTCIYSMLWPDTSIHGKHVFNIIGINGTGSPGGLGFDAVGTTFTVG
jgi:hypothetical protein